MRCWRRIDPRIYVNELGASHGHERQSNATTRRACSQQSSNGHVQLGKRGGPRCAALRLMAQHDQVHRVKLEQLRQEIKLGLNSGDASTWDAVSFKRQARQRQQAGNKPA